MDTKYLKEEISTLNLYRWRLIQTNINRLVIFKTKYKYTDCIYVDVNVDEAIIRRERVFDNKYLNLPVKRLLISNINLNKELDLLEYIKDIIEK